MSNQEEQEENGKEEQAAEAETVSVKELELESLRQQASDYKHKYLHLLADSENSRKRLQKDRDEIVQYSIRSILLDFLDPTDHLQNALKYTEGASDEVKHWAKGFKMILNQYLDVLASNNVKPIDSIGKEFDPHLHEAIEMIETAEYPPGVVLEESIRGYTIGEKTLRPARVKVSKAKKISPDSASLDEEAEKQN